MVDNPSIAVYAFPKSMLTSFFVDEISIPRYMSWSSVLKSCYLIVG